MATALLVPVTFFMPPVPAIASIVTATAMAIFAGDIPSCLLRMPGTPASAAYSDEAYALTKEGRGELALGSGLWFSILGGLFGTAVLIAAAPSLAEIALKFSSFEYFWLVVLGLASAVFLAIGNPLKGVVSLLFGLLVASEGLDNPAGYPRFTFGNAELAAGLTLIPIVIGVLYIKGLNPGPTIFMNNAPAVYAIFMVFILANLLMLPLGIAAIRAAKQMLRAPREVLLPVILLFCIVGSFAINNSIFGVVLMLAFGIVGYVMEENGFPIAPAILGMVLVARLEENFTSSRRKADGRLLAFFERPIAGALGVLTIIVFSVPLIRRTIAVPWRRKEK